MNKEERDKLCKAIADALSLDTEGIMAHFSCIQKDSQDQAVLFAFTQMRMFEMHIDDGILTLTPRNKIDDLINKSIPHKNLILPPPGKFELMDPHCFKEIGKYIRSIKPTE